MSSECVACAKDREEDAYASVMHSNMNALEYQRFGADCLELENNRRFELNARRPSRCNDQRSETECMYPVPCVKSVTKRLMASGMSSATKCGSAQRSSLSCLYSHASQQPNPRTPIPEIHENTSANTQTLFVPSARCSNGKSFSGSTLRTERCVDGTLNVLAPP